jgi:16S rRNA processing protein RimM
MNIDECFELGYIIKPHGLNGSVNVLLDTDFPEDYKSLESVFVNIRQKLIPFFINTIQINGNKAIVNFEDINTIEQSEELKGCSLHLPESMLPVLEGQNFYYHEVIGFEMIDDKDGNIGKISGYVDNSSQVILTVDHNNNEVLIPVADHIIAEIDRVKKIMYVTLPDGLLDIYK